jgi:hypothetical protein
MSRRCATDLLLPSVRNAYAMLPFSIPLQKKRDQCSETGRHHLLQSWKMLMQGLGRMVCRFKLCQAKLQQQGRVCQFATAQQLHAVSQVGLPADNCACHSVELAVPRNDRQSYI